MDIQEDEGEARVEKRVVVTPDWEWTRLVRGDEKMM
jgi:hypothetical protein